MAQFVPGTAAEPTSEVELTISCRNVLDMDVFSKSDPFCVVYSRSFEEAAWQEICRTEVIYNNLNPNFVTKVHMFYRFEEKQNLKFEVYDEDKKTASLKDQDFLGYCQCTLGQVVANGKLEMPLLGMPSHAGTLTLSVEELAAVKDEVVLQFSGKNLSKKGFLGTNAFLELSRVNERGEYVVVHRTEIMKSNFKPVWRPFTIPVRTLCGGDDERSIKVACLHYGFTGNFKPIGEFYVTLRQLKEGPGANNVFSCVNPKKKQKNPAYKQSGDVQLNHFELRKVYSFVDYIMGGMDMNCTIAIDFTASNGNPQLPNSLHYVSDRPNPYEQALAAVGEIIQDYDSDKLFPLLGFGARLPPDGRVSHEFFVNMHPSNPYCEGIPGVLAAYRECIRQVQLYGPTNFSPVIRHVAKFAAAHTDGSHYFILLILTDGVITDMPLTKEAIIDASTLPMSIIIVGVGNADFEAMNELDADTVPLEIHGRMMARDIVQFVSYRDFERVYDVPKAKAYLAKEVLAEIPGQIVGYMKATRIVPKPPTHLNAPPLYEA